MANYFTPRRAQRLTGIPGTGPSPGIRPAGITPRQGPGYTPGVGLRPGGPVMQPPVPVIGADDRKPQVTPVTDPPDFRKDMYIQNPPGGKGLGAMLDPTRRTPLVDEGSNTAGITPLPPVAESKPYAKPMRERQPLMLEEPEFATPPRRRRRWRL